MQRLKYIIIITLIILLAGSGTVFGILMHLSGLTEKKYQDALAAVNKGEWNSAASLIEQIPNYKDTPMLYNYIYPHVLYYSKYNSDSEAVKGYKQALIYIKSHKNEFISAKEPKYSSEILEFEKILNFKVAELNTKSQYETIRLSLNDSINLIKKGDYSGAQQKLNTVNNDEFANEKQQLAAYINLLNTIKTNDQKEILKAIGSLDPSYSGDLSNEIKTSVQPYADTNKWTALYKPVVDKTQTATAEITVGDNKNNVILSLGTPVKQNVISNKYGTFEELVFINKLIYIENNIVTAVGTHS